LKHRHAKVVRPFTLSIRLSNCFDWDCVIRCHLSVALFENTTRSDEKLLLFKLSHFCRTHFEILTRGAFVDRLFPHLFFLFEILVFILVHLKLNVNWFVLTELYCSLYLLCLSTLLLHLNYFSCCNLPDTNLRLRITVIMF
jgi:hypothetical protein